MPWGKRFPLALQRGTVTRPTVAGRVAMGLHNSPGPLALGKPGRAYYYAACVWELGCEHREMALGLCSRPDNFDVGLAGCAEPAGVPKSHKWFPGRTKMMFRGYHGQSRSTCVTVVLT